MALRNWEITVYALYLLKGVSRFVHTEEIAVKCFELAPESFSWTRYRELPDKDIVRVALTDARKEKMGELVRGRSGRGKGHSTDTVDHRRTDGWQLTETGAAWVVENEKRLEEVLGERQPKPHRQEILRKLERVRTHKLFRQFETEREAFQPSIGDMGDLFRCRPDAETAVWKKRFGVLRNQAKLTERPDILDFIDKCEEYIEARRG